MAKKNRKTQSTDALYDQYVDSKIPEIMLTPSQAASMNRDTPNNAFMQKVGDEFYYPEELSPSVVSDDLSLRAHNIAQGSKAANELSEKQNEFGSKYAAPGFALAMFAPWAIGAAAGAAANPLLFGTKLMNGLRYLQPSTYLDPLFGGAAASGLAAPSFYTMGAKTLMGGLADAAVDSYFATEGIRNAGKMGSVPGEIMNGLNFLPLLAPGAQLAGRGYNAYMGSKAASAANDAATLAAKERGLIKATHGASGAKVWLDPSTGKYFTYSNKEFVPFDESLGWIPNEISPHGYDNIQFLSEPEEAFAPTFGVDANGNFDWDALEAIQNAANETTLPTNMADAATPAQLNAEEIKANLMSNLTPGDHISDIAATMSNKDKMKLYGSYSDDELSDVIFELKTHTNDIVNDTDLIEDIENFLSWRKLKNEDGEDAVSYLISAIGGDGGQNPIDFANDFITTKRIKETIDGLSDKEIDNLIDTLRSSRNENYIVLANRIAKMSGMDVPISALSSLERERYTNKARESIDFIRKYYPDDWSIDDIFNNADKNGVIDNIVNDPFEGPDFENEIKYGLEFIGDEDSKALLKAIEGYDRDAIKQAKEDAKLKYSGVGMGGPSRNTEIWNKVRRIIFDAKHGNRAPLPKTAVDVFGEKFDLPDYMAAFMETDEFKQMYPDGVDFFWRGTSGLGDKWHRAETGYPSYFGGDRMMAGGYNAGSFSGGKTPKYSHRIKEGQEPNIMLMYVPKGQLFRANPQSGAYWSNMLHDGTNPELIKLTNMHADYGDKKYELEKKIDKLHSRLLKGGKVDSELKFAREQLEDIEKIMSSIRGDFRTIQSAEKNWLRIPKLGPGVFRTTDEVAKALSPDFYLSPDFPYSGVILPDIDDGPRANEIIWNPLRGGYPKVVHPDMRMNGRLGDKTYLNDGGTLLRKYDGGGEFPKFSPLADFRAAHAPVNESRFQGFGGGSFGGGGTSVPFDISLDPTVVEQYVRNTPIPIERSFSDAYGAARRAGLPEFEFNGKIYNTEYDPNAKLGPRETESLPVLNLREVLDENKRPISDSTRVEPYLGQIPGVHRKDYGGMIDRLAKTFNGDYGAMLEAFNKVRARLKR